MEILAVRLGDDIVEVLLCTKTIPLIISTIAAIPHIILEMVASSTDTLSRSGQSSLMGCYPLGPAPAF